MSYYDRKHHYTYRVKFPSQKWYYYGVHSTNDLNDGYQGSPKTHREKWKWFSHEFEILEFHETRDDAETVETRLIRQTKGPYSLNVWEKSFPPSATENSMKNHRVPVFVVELETWVTFEFSSVKEAIDTLSLNRKVFTSLKSLTAVCGYFIRRKSEHTLEETVELAKTVKRKRKMNEPVVLTNLDTGETRRFPRIKEACDELNLSSTHLHRVLTGTLKRHGRWTGHYERLSLRS